MDNPSDGPDTTGPAGQRSGSPTEPLTGPARGLTIAGAALAVIGYLLGFVDGAQPLVAGPAGVLLLAGGLLAATTLLPRPAGMLGAVAAVLVVLGVLQGLLWVLTGSSRVDAVVIIVLLFGFFEALALVGALLMRHGVLKPRLRRSGARQGQSGYGQAGYPPPGYGQQAAGGPGYQQPVSPYSGPAYQGGAYPSGRAGEWQQPQPGHAQPPGGYGGYPAPGAPQAGYPKPGEGYAAPGYPGGYGQPPYGGAPAQSAPPYYPPGAPPPASAQPGSPPPGWSEAATQAGPLPSSPGPAPADPAASSNPTQRLEAWNADPDRSFSPEPGSGSEWAGRGTDTGSEWPPERGPSPDGTTRPDGSS
jgi:hypothetical protein